MQTNTNWQNKFDAEDAHSEDARNLIRIIVGLVLFGIAIPVIAAIVMVISVLYSSNLDGILPGIWAILRIILTLVVFVAGMVFVRRQAEEYFRQVYQPPPETSVPKVISLRVFGIPPMPPLINETLNYPYILIRDGKPDKPNDQAFWLGGPRRLVILDGSAAYIERCNIFSRVVGPGVTFLERHEIITHIIDLRPQTYAGVVKAWTKDGIEVEAKVQITCRVGTHSINKIEPAQGNLADLPDNIELPPPQPIIYPFDPICVRKAVEWTKVKRRFTAEGKEEFYDAEWVESAWGQVQGDLAVYISKKHIDNLFTATREQPMGGLLLSKNEREKIRASLDDRLQNEAGVSLIDLQITEFTITDEVLAKRVEKWKTAWEARDDIRKARTEADAIKAEESARAEAQRDLILEIAEGLSRSEPEDFSNAVMLALSGFLDQSLGDPSLQADIARETLETLEKIQEMLKGS